jgi:hypothetical protein
VALVARDKNDAYEIFKRQRKERREVLFGKFTFRKDDAMLASMEAVRKPRFSPSYAK